MERQGEAEGRRTDPYIPARTLRRQGAQLIAMGLFPLCMGLLLLIQVAGSLVFFRGAGVWPQVTGTILSAGTRAEDHGTGSSKRTYVYPEFTYLFEYQGKPYTGTRLEHFGAWHNAAYSDKKTDAARELAAHPVGSPVTVYVNPYFPRWAVLFPDRGVNLGGFMALPFLAVFWGFGGLLVRMGLRQRTRAREEERGGEPPTAVPGEVLAVRLLADHRHADEVRRRRLPLVVAGVALALLVGGVACWPFGAVIAGLCCLVVLNGSNRIDTPFETTGRRLATHGEGFLAMEASSACPRMGETLEIAVLDHAEGRRGSPTVELIVGSRARPNRTPVDWNELVARQVVEVKLEAGSRSPRGKGPVISRGRVQVPAHVGDVRAGDLAWVFRVAIPGDRRQVFHFPLGVTGTVGQPAGGAEGQSMDVAPAAADAAPGQGVPLVGNSLAPQDDRVLATRFLREGERLVWVGERKSVAVDRALRWWMPATSALLVLFFGYLEVSAVRELIRNPGFGAGVGVLIIGLFLCGACLGVREGFLGRLSLWDVAEPRRLAVITDQRVLLLSPLGPSGDDFEWGEETPADAREYSIEREHSLCEVGGVRVEARGERRDLVLTRATGEPDLGEGKSMRWFRPPTDVLLRLEDPEEPGHVAGLVRSVLAARGSSES